ncbi:phosphatase PAP2 family protein [Martelella radicis]|uniref:Undecaprenyl-diphosphatase n=1 Tax=Martelella radicis TaxID=1397476 RepID=A0A7W6KIR2_9HYPH|nr:phosphatase PAP2 family protein [Martelella radicis]MBB4121877.1 undecaprenyl-diphosphatase [Martelella radicis]
MTEKHQSLPATGRTRLRLFWKRKPARKPFSLSATRWPWFLLPAATMALLSLAALDGPVASARDAMSPSFQDVAVRLTDVTTAPWILMASGAVTLAALAVLAGADRVAVRCRAVHVAHQASYVFASVALASATVNVVKRLIGRARPSLFDSVGDLHFRLGGWAYDYASFPSGHATTSGAVFATLALLFPRAGPVFASLAIFFAYARVAVGAHYPSDISTGLFYGAWVAVFVAVVFARYRLLFLIPEKGLPERRG